MKHRVAAGQRHTAGRKSWRPSSPTIPPCRPGSFSEDGILSTTRQERYEQQERRDREDQQARAKAQREKDLIAQWDAAWNQYSKACCQMLPIKQTGLAVQSLVGLLRDQELIDLLRHRQLFAGGRADEPRVLLQIIADAWDSRQGEAEAVGFLIETWDDRPDAQKLGMLIKASPILRRDPGCVSDEVENVRCAVRSGFSPAAPRPTPTKPTATAGRGVAPRNEWFLETIRNPHVGHLPQADADSSHMVGIDG